MNPADDTGNEILEVISNAGKFNEWMYKTITPFLHGNILEIGSGIGNISQFFLADKKIITLSDTDGYYLQTLRQKFSGFSNLKEVLEINLEHPQFESIYHPLKEQYDSIFLLNVLEHIRNDSLAIENCKHLLKQGGTLLLLCPAYSFLYSALDKELGHHRRYTISKLNSLLKNHDLIIKKKFYFNAIGVIAWYYGKLMKLKTIPSSDMGLYNKLVPVAKFIDKITFRKKGLSAIIIAEKKERNI